MRIHRSRPGAGFTRIPNETLRDERLSMAARGHLAYLLSRPRDWITNADAEARRARSLRDKRGEGRRAVRAIYAELKQAGYLHSVKVPGPSGRWVTETYLYDRPTDVPPTGIPETGTSAPPAQTPEPVDNLPENDAEFAQVTEFPQFAPTYRSPGVGPPARRSTGTPANGTSLRSTEDVGTEDEGAGNPIAGKGQEQPNANSQASSHWPGNDGPDAQRIPLHDPESPAADRYAREAPNGYRFRSQQEIAAQQVAEARAQREAAERAAR